MCLFSNGQAIRQSVAWLTSLSSCYYTANRTSQRTVFRMLSTRNKYSSSHRNLQSIVAAGVIGVVGVTIYYIRGASNTGPEFAESVFQIPHVDGKSASTMYQYKSMWFPKELFANEQSFKKLKSFSLRSDDVLVVSFPKSGYFPSYSDSNICNFSCCSKYILCNHVSTSLYSYHTFCC